MAEENVSPDPNIGLPQEQVDPNLVQPSSEAFQIEVTQPDEAVTETIAEHPATTEPQADTADPDEGRIKDHDKAEDMAWAGKKQRDYAIGSRQQAAQRRDLVKRIDAFNSEPEDDTPEQLQASTERANALKEEIRSLKYEYDEPWGDKDPHSRRYIERNTQLYYDKKAEEYDEKAERREDWAATLYDHPVSEAYKAAHDNYSFSASELSTRQENIDAIKAKLERMEKALGDGGNHIWIHGIRDYEPDRVYRHAYGLTPQEYKHYKDKGETLEKLGITEDEASKLEEYLKLTSDPGTTLGQLRDFYIEAFEAGYIKPEKDVIESDQQVLDDVRSGRASESPPPAAS